MKIKQIRSGQAIAATVVVVLIGGCGGGGGGGDTAVSPGTTPAPAPSPAPSASPAPVPATPVPAPTQPPPSLIVVPPPAAPTPTPAPGAPRASVIRALVQATDQVAVDSNGGAFDLSHDVTGKAFSTIRSSTAQGRLTASSTLTLGGEDATAAFVPKREVILSAAVSTDGVSTYTFTGTGSITSSSGQTSISASPYSLPDPVPFNQTLHQLNVTGSSTNSVRFLVGTIDNRPELMRVCWRIELPGILRVACTRHQRSTGNLVGGDTVNDLGGTLYYHEAEIGDSFEPSVLRCVDRSFAAPNSTVTDYRFGVAAFDRSKSNGGLFPPPTQYYTQSTTVPGNDTVDYRLTLSPPGFVGSEATARVVGARRIIQYAFRGASTSSALNRDCTQ